MSDIAFIAGQSYEPLRRLISDKRIQEIQSKIRVRKSQEDVKWDEATISIKDMPPSDWQPQYLIAIDGDYHKQKIENGFPGAEFGYITVSTVLILLEKVQELEKDKFIDPQKFRETEQPSSIDAIIMGCNSVLEGDTSAQHSMRRTFFNELKLRRTFQDTETLLDTYHVLLDERGGGGRATKCPYENCDEDLHSEKDEYICNSCGGKLYSTDALRLYELLNPAGTSGELYGQVMETFKKLQLIHILRSFEQHPKYFPLLKDIAFFIEGTLAVFSTASWLAIPIRKELQRINEKLKDQFGRELLILGIERTGNFVNHFSDIDTKKDGTTDNYPNEAAFLITNDYIKKNIVFRDDPDYIYLEDTAFGRKFFYKTKSGYRVVSSIANYNNYQSNTTTAFPAQFPRLADVLSLLNKLVSSHYENSVIPLATAYSEAAIPLNIGKRIFDDIAKQMREQRP